MSYEMTNSGYKKKLKKASFEPVDTKIDPETGEVKYTKRGRPCKKPTPEDVANVYNRDDANDIDPETGEVL